MGGSFAKLLRNILECKTRRHRQRIFLCETCYKERNYTSCEQCDNINFKVIIFPFSDPVEVIDLNHTPLNFENDFENLLNNCGLSNCTGFNIDNIELIDKNIDNNNASNILVVQDSINKCNLPPEITKEDLLNCSNNGIIAPHLVISLSTLSLQRNSDNNTITINSNHEDNGEEIQITPMLFNNLEDNSVFNKIQNITDDEYEIIQNFVNGNEIKPVNSNNVSNNPEEIKITSKNSIENPHNNIETEVENEDNSTILELGKISHVSINVGTSDSSVTNLIQELNRVSIHLKNFNEDIEENSSVKNRFPKLDKIKKSTFFKKTNKENTIFDQLSLKTVNSYENNDNVKLKNVNSKQRVHILLSEKKNVDNDLSKSRCINLNFGKDNGKLKSAKVSIIKVQQKSNNLKENKSVEANIFNENYLKKTELINKNDCKTIKQRKRLNDVKKHAKTLHYKLNKCSIINQCKCKITSVNKNPSNKIRKCCLTTN